MPSTHLSHDAFFDKLGELFSHRKSSDHGAIYLTQKRLSHDQGSPVAGEGDSFPDLHPGKPMPVIVRATNGKSKKDRAKKIKFSTVVEPDDLETFYVQYADLCKAGMSALKPRDRSKKKAKAKKKKAAS